MRENLTKSKLRAGQVVAGLMATSSDPELAELAGLLGFDFYLLDAEHGALSPRDATNVARACDAVGITPVVRVGQRDPKVLLQYLDAGMMGVMSPDCTNAEQVRALVAAVKYPPLGERGLGVTRGSDYLVGPRSQAEHVRFANHETMVWPQVESPLDAAQLEAMAAVPGVDALVIGPRDLALNMGFPDGPNYGEVQAVIERVLEAGRRKRVAIGITAATADAGKAELARGARILLNSLPNLLRPSARAFLDGLGTRVAQ